MFLHGLARFLMAGGLLVAWGDSVSSETRTDSGPGACEVLYIDGFDNVASPNRGWRAAMWSALGALLLGLVLWMFLPMRADG